MSADNDEPVVIAYSVKEILAELRNNVTAGFARVETKLDGKADKSDIARLEKTVNDHHTRIGDLERRQRDDETARETREKSTGDRRLLRDRVWAVVGSVSTAALAYLTWRTATGH